MYHKWTQRVSERQWRKETDRKEFNFVFEVGFPEKFKGGEFLIEYS